MVIHTNYTYSTKYFTEFNKYFLFKTTFVINNWVYFVEV